MLLQQIKGELGHLQNSTFMFRFVIQLHNNLPDLVLKFSNYKFNILNFW